MKKPEITPGPWRVGNYRPYRQVVQAKDPSTDNDSRPGSRQICRLNDNSNQKANAQAISAVPEMLDALIEARDYVRECGYEGEEWEEILIKQIESALKKAGVDL